MAAKHRDSEDLTTEAVEAPDRPITRWADAMRAGMSLKKGSTSAATPRPT